MNILTAYIDNKNIFTLERHLSKNYLESLRSNSQFSCPQCGNPLRLKIGKVVTPHFAHIVLNDCFTSFSERESPKHLIGKQQLAEFYKRLGYKVEVEAFIPKISQRPDIVIKKDRKLFAIEFQCSVISADDIQKRNDGYHQVKIPYIWILRTPATINLNKTGVTLVKLTRFEQSFITVDDCSKPTLITYDAFSNQFVYLSELLYINGTTFIAKVCILSIDHQIFPFAHVKSLSMTEQKQYWKIYQHKRQKFLTNRIYSSKLGTKDRLLNNCYHHRIRPLDLPLYIGFPISGAKVIQNHPTEWQFALICQLSQMKMDLSDISEGWIESFLAEHCRLTDLKSALEVVYKYGEFLQQVNYNPSEPVSKQMVEESYLINYFHRFIVAKR